MLAYFFKVFNNHFRKFEVCFSQMLNSGMPELDILKYLGITKSDLEEIKKCK